MTLPIIILAGGLASRLRPITKRIPKSLIEVAGVPFVVRQLNYLKKQNIEKVIMCVGHMGEMIEELLQRIMTKLMVCPLGSLPRSFVVTNRGHKAKV